MGENEAVVIDTPGGIAMYNWLRTMHMIALELNTGMKNSRGPILRQMHQAGMIDTELRSTKANKQRVLTSMVEEMKKLDSKYEPSDSIKRALAK